MDLQKQESSFLPRESKKKQKGKRRFGFWKVCLVTLLILILGAGGFLYGTNQGKQLREMIIGTVLSSQHPQYVNYLHFLLPQKDIDSLYNTMKHPKVVQSTIEHVTYPEKAENNNAIQTLEVDNPNFTAKVLIIPNPKTVHLVVTKYPDKGQPLSDLIQENGGIAGINGGGFYDKGGHGSGGKMIGIAISNGKVLSAPSSGNNVARLVGGFLASGEFISGNYSINQLQKLGVTDAVQFGPQIIVNGKSAVSSAINGAWGWAPRTAIGQEENGSIVMIATDGRFYWDKRHRGASMADMAQMFESYHVTNAIAMDGGGSTTMMKDGKLLLKPATEESIGMRYLPNAWVVYPN